jgi:hypothetical protein
LFLLAKKARKASLVDVNDSGSGNAVKLRVHKRHHAQVLWRDKNGCAVGLHDCQDSRIGQRTAQGSGNDRSAGMRTKHTKSMSVALCRSGQHCNERSIVIELNEKSSLRRYLSLSC